MATKFIGIKLTKDKEIEVGVPIGFPYLKSATKRITEFTRDEKIGLRYLILLIRQMKKFDKHDETDYVKNVIDEIIEDYSESVLKSLKKFPSRASDFVDYNRIDRYIAKNEVIYSKNGNAIPYNVTSMQKTLGIDTVSELFAYVVYELNFLAGRKNKCSNFVKELADSFRQKFLYSGAHLLDKRAYSIVEEIFFKLDRDIKVRTPALKRAMELLWNFFNMNLISFSFKKPKEKIFIGSLKFYDVWEKFCLCFIEKEILEPNKNIEVMFSDIPYLEKRLKDYENCNENTLYLGNYGKYAEESVFQIILKDKSKKIKNISRLKPDIVLKKGNKIFIIDYKYTINSEGQKFNNDILKQHFYKMAVKKYENNAEIEMIFLVPDKKKVNKEINKINEKMIKSIWNPAEIKIWDLNDLRGKVLNNTNNDENKAKKDKAYLKALKAFLEKDFEKFNYLSYFTKNDLDIVVKKENTELSKVDISFYKKTEMSHSVISEWDWFKIFDL